MPVLLQFKGGEELELSVEPGQWADAFKKALHNNEVLEVRGSDGRTLGINPRAVLYWILDSRSPAPEEYDALR